MPILSWLRTDCPGEPKEVLRSVEDVVRFVVLVARSPFLQHQHVVVVVVVVVRSLIRPNYLVSAWLQLDCCNFESDSDCVHVLHVGSRAGAACIRRSETLFSTTPLLPEDNRECRCSCSDSIKKDENAAVHFLTSIVVTDVVLLPSHTPCDCMQVEGAMHDLQSRRARAHGGCQTWRDAKTNGTAPVGIDAAAAAFHRQLPRFVRVSLAARCTYFCGGGSGGSGGGVGAVCVHVHACVARRNAEVVVVLFVVLAGVLPPPLVRW